MQPYRFRLERVLHWQRRVWDAEQRQLEQAFAALAESRERLAQLASYSAVAEQQFLKQTAMAPADLRALAEDRRKTKAERLRLERQVNQEQIEIARQQERVMRERSKLEALEKLRARSWSAHQLAEEKELEALGLESHLAAHFK